jgi:hypothetical protein
MSLEPPDFNLSFSTPGTYFIGIFASFSNGNGVTLAGRANARGSSGGGDYGLLPDGFPSQRAPLASLGDTGGTTFQPIAVTVPFANGTSTPLPRGFRGKSVVLPPIPGDCRLAIQPTGDGATTAVTMFDGGVINLNLMMPFSMEPVDYMEFELPSCMSLPNASDANKYRYSVANVPSYSPSGDGGGAAWQQRPGLANLSDTTNSDTYRVRLTAGQVGMWSSDQRTLQLWPRISCAVCVPYYLYSAAL